MGMNHETCHEIETAIAKYFNPRQNVIVPNVWWGLGLNHECDLFVMTKSGHAYEIEIKTSKADLRKDLNKRHQHISKYLRRLYFALPEKLADCVGLIPEKAGILMVQSNGHVIKQREAQINKTAVPLSVKQQLKLGHLGTMRIWTLKHSLIEARRDNAVTKASA